jgi:hypothetical protein
MKHGSQVSLQHQPPQPPQPPPIQPHLLENVFGAVFKLLLLFLDLLGQACDSLSTLSFAARRRVVLLRLLELALKDLQGWGVGERGRGLVMA